MRFSDDKAVIAMLYRTPHTMKTFRRTFSSFCQWCGDQRTPIATETPEHRVLMCAACDFSEDE